MSYTRQRQSFSYYSGYRIKNNTGAVNWSSYTSSDAFVEDYVSKGDNYNLTVERTSQTGGKIYGTQASFLTGYAWWLYPADYFVSDPWRKSHLTVPGAPSDGSLATTALARTNPSRSSMVAMEHISELLSAPSALKKSTDDLIKRLPKRFQYLNKAAKLNILTQFGINPIISDIETLFKFQELVDKRVDEIERLRGTRGLRRTISSLWYGETVAYDYNRIIQSNGVTLRCNFTKQSSLNIGAHVRWRSSANWLKSDSLVREKAKRAISAYKLDPATLYELMPWSWLIDYCSNLGEFIKTTTNDFDAIHEPVRLIKTHLTRTQSWGHQNSGSGANIIQFTPFDCVTVSKSRAPAMPTLSARIGFLDENQLSILGSLLILKSM